MTIINTNRKMSGEELRQHMMLRGRARTFQDKSKMKSKYGARKNRQWYNEN